ncbi:MAG: putative PEP-binding protein, partial [Anaerolineales bacterium]
VFGSWDNVRAETYRRLHRIPGGWGTAVNVQAMVFGNRGETSATGVAFTRDPSTGEKKFYGEFLPNAQGEDVVAGIRTPRPLSSDGSGCSLEETMPQAYAELLRLQDLLEKSFRDMQDLEFTIEDRKLYILQTRNGKRTGFAAVRIATDMVAEGLIGEEEALARVEPEQLVQLLAPVFPAKEKEAAVHGGNFLGKGLPAGPGAACGRIAFTAKRAVEMAAGGQPVVLVREETSPEDIAGMHAAAGILTTRGGRTSHAAVVARGKGKTCVVGAGEITVEAKSGELRAKKLRAGEGDWISIDGTTGEVILGKLPTQPSEVLQVLFGRTVSAEKSPLFSAFSRLLSWADSRRRLGVRANADTPTDARVAVLFGAEGIGLCRTEHMFFEESRILAVREMILAESSEGRRAALAKILPMQRDDFLGLFRQMQERPVTIRLLDPPLHEFLPHEEEAVRKTAAELKVSPEKLRERVRALSEANPMLGHRGCRLGITHPEIYETQARAIFEAAAAAVGEGLRP